MNKYKPSYAEAPHEIRNWKYGYPQHLFKELESKILNTMNEIKFNSQICTTKEQSQRLLALGLKPETADMYIFDNEVYIGTPNVDDIPAWSLHRLFDIMYVHCHELKACENVYDAMIKRIEKTIEHNTHNEYYFNKEYLKQCQTKGDTECI